MPIYEYKCNKCGEKFEVRRSIFADSKDKVTCSRCGSTESERVFSSFFTANGSGGSCSTTSSGRFT